MAFDAGSLGAEALLAIPVDEPERIFSNNADELKKSFRKLAQRIDEWGIFSVSLAQRVR